MKTILMLIFSVLFCNCQSISDSSDVETIWENYLTKFGDKEKIGKLRTIFYVTKTDFLNINKTGRLECFIKDNKIKIHFIGEDMDATTIYDGKNFTRYINGEKVDVPKSEESGILRNIDFFHEVNYKKHSFNIKLEGTEKINNIESYKIKYYSNDLISYYYINKNDYSLIKITDEFQEFWPSGIKSKKGMNYFSKFKSTDQYGTSIGEIISIEFDGEINDSVFNEYK